MVSFPYSVFFLFFLLLFFWFFLFCLFFFLSYIPLSTWLILKQIEFDFSSNLFCGNVWFDCVGEDVDSLTEVNNINILLLDTILSPVKKQQTFLFVYICCCLLVGEGEALKSYGFLLGLHVDWANMERYITHTQTHTYIHAYIYIRIYILIYTYIANAIFVGFVV